MRPETIERALEFVQEELNTMYLQHRNDHLPDRRGPIKANHPHPGQSKLFNVNHNMPQPSYNKPFNFSTPGPSRFHNTLPPAPYQLRQNFSQFNQAGPSRTQQMFRALPPNYNPNNAFRPPPRNTATQYPRPMSGVSHFSTKPVRPNTFGNNVHDWNKSGNPPPSNYFRTREMNFNNCMTYEPHDYHYPDEYNMPYCDYYDYSDYHYNEYDSQSHDQYPQVTVENYSEEQNHQVETSNNDHNQDFQLAPNLEKRK
jgi:hypothetical protein